MSADAILCQLLLLRGGVKETLGWIHSELRPAHLARLRFNAGYQAEAKPMLHGAV